jgi:hypothetical protein
VTLRRLNEELARLRRYRNRPDPDLSLAAPLRDAGRELQRQCRAASGIAGAWTEVLPPDLSRGSEVLSFSRGLLTVRTADSAARFQIDRFLRGGGQAALARRAGVAVRRIRLL